MPKTQMNLSTLARNLFTYGGMTVLASKNIYMTSSACALVAISELRRRARCCTWRKRSNSVLLSSSQYRRRHTFCHLRGLHLPLPFSFTLPLLRFELADPERDLAFVSLLRQGVFDLKLVLLASAAAVRLLYAEPPLLTLKNEDLALPNERERLQLAADLKLC